MPGLIQGSRLTTLLVVTLIHEPFSELLEYSHLEAIEK